MKRLFINNIGEANLQSKPGDFLLRNRTIYIDKGGVWTREAEIEGSYFLVPKISSYNEAGFAATPYGQEWMGARNKEDKVLLRVPGVQHFLYPEEAEALGSALITMAVKARERVDHG